jgi:hypothetical protein
MNIDDLDINGLSKTINDFLNPKLVHRFLFAPSTLLYFKRFWEESDCEMAVKNRKWRQDRMNKDIPFNFYNYGIPVQVDKKLAEGAWMAVDRDDVVIDSGNILPKK